MQGNFFALNVNVYTIINMHTVFSPRTSNILNIRQVFFHNIVLYYTLLKHYETTIIYNKTHPVRASLGAYVHIHVTYSIYALPFH
jgi:hypothetical protein